MACAFLLHCSVLLHCCVLLQCAVLLHCCVLLHRFAVSFCCTVAFCYIRLLFFSVRFCNLLGCLFLGRSCRWGVQQRRRLLDADPRPAACWLGSRVRRRLLRGRGPRSSDRVPQAVTRLWVARNSGRAGGGSGGGRAVGVLGRGGSFGCSNRAYTRSISAASQVVIQISWISAIANHFGV